METELNAVREKLLAEKTSVELELKTVNEDLTNQLTQATSQVGKTTQFYSVFDFLHNSFRRCYQSYLLTYSPTY